MHCAKAPPDMLTAIVKAKNAAAPRLSSLCKAAVLLRRFAVMADS
jgi:hypothetical protein